MLPTRDSEVPQWGADEECDRFEIDSKNASIASGFIRRTLEGGLIRIADPEHPRAGDMSQRGPRFEIECGVNCGV